VVACAGTGRDPQGGREPAPGGATTVVAAPAGGAGGERPVPEPQEDDDEEGAAAGTGGAAGDGAADDAARDPADEGLATSAEAPDAAPPNASVAPPPSPPPARPLAVVLSVGGAQGLAHLGALRALAGEEVRVAAVVGTSMGALAGALWASAPEDDPVARYRELVAAYRDDATTVRSAGDLVTVIRGIAAVWGLGDAADLIEHDRFVAVLDRFLGSARIEQLPVPFVTAYLALRDDGVTPVTVRRGPVARAVGGSIANPLVFRGYDARAARRLDPGVDRLAAVPVALACRSFPDHRLLVLNVTGRPAVRPGGLPCPIVERRVRLPEVDPAQALAGGPDLDRLVAAGARAVRRALEDAPSVPDWCGEGPDEAVRPCRRR